MGRIADLRVLRTRRGFRPQVFARDQRRRPEVDESIGEMFVQGVSTSGVGRVVEDLTGVNPSPNTVSRVFHRLEDEFTAWKPRKRLVHEHIHLENQSRGFTALRVFDFALDQCL